MNSYIKPIVKALSMPIGLLTMGLVAFVINAAMLLLVALASDQLKLGFKVGDFPPKFTSDTIIGALRRRPDHQRRLDGRQHRAQAAEADLSGAFGR